EDESGLQAHKLKAQACENAGPNHIRDDHAKRRKGSKLAWAVHKQYPQKARPEPIRLGLCNVTQRETRKEGKPIYEPAQSDQPTNLRPELSTPAREA
ncbi:MAG: hypothetical protein ACON4C_11475, partial [Henriciella sp.]